MKYTVKEHIKPKDLIAISNEQISDHWKLYEGYVAKVNQLNNELAELRVEGKEETLAYSDRQRRYGFEYNGMVLHEYYFENLKANEESNPSPKLRIINKKIGKYILEAIEKYFGSFDNWKKNFINTGKMRGIGWTILYADPKTRYLINCFVGEHQDGHIAGFKPIVVMDIWEHAYMVDHKSGERLKYIEAFMKNINWDIVEKRY